jgi:MFS transporter, FSR family, fosmidomycin resistance protein
MGRAKAVRSGDEPLSRPASLAKLPAMDHSPGRAVLVFACLGHALFHIIAALFLTLVLVLQPAWKLPYNDLIALWTLGAFLLGFGAPIAGWLGDRLGETRVMIVYFLGMGGSSIACGMAEGPLSLKISLSAMGLFGAIYHPVGTAWVVKNVTRRGRSIAILGICGSIGIALASLVAAGINDLAGWRAAFTVPGMMAIGVGLALLAAYATGRIVDRDTDVAIEAEPNRSDVRRAFIVLVVTMTLTSLVYQSFSTMLPKWIGRELGGDLGQGLFGLGALVTVIYLSGAVAQIFGGYFTDRGMMKPVYIIAFMLKLCALAAATMLGGWSIVAAAMAMAFVFDLASLLENVLIARYTPSGRRGLAYGVRHGIAIVAAPLGVQLVAVLFSETAGFALLLQVLAAFVIVILSVAMLLPADRPAAAARPVGAAE